MMYKDQRDVENVFVEYWTINDTEPNAKNFQNISNDIFTKTNNYATHSYYYKDLIFGIFIRVFKTLLNLYIGK